MASATAMATAEQPGARDPTPHVYTIAKKAYTSLVDAMALSLEEAKRMAEEWGVHTDQSVLISGESGAGKTEAAKRVLEYLTTASRSAKLADSRSSVSGADPSALAVPGGSGKSWDDEGGGESGGKISIEALLREASPVLEALGNAKTIRNDNSSRFGKYVRLLMTPEGALCGATLEKYLLEKSRVVLHSEGEQSYHAFYQLVYGASDTAKAYKLDPSIKYRYLTPGGTQSDPPAQDPNVWSKEYAEVDTALKSLLSANPSSIGKDGFYWKAIAGVLHLGQVTFSPKADGTAGCEISEPAAKASLAALCDLWGITTEGIAALEDALTHRTVLLAGASERYARDPKQARAQADALAKEVYDRLFTMLVHEVGGALGGGEGSMVDLSAAAAGKETLPPHIGLLDIFGFEIFDGSKNGFEQVHWRKRRQHRQQSASTAQPQPLPPHPHPSPYTLPFAATHQLRER